MQFAERVWSLGLYLRGALALVQLDMYLPALAVLRSALEHHVQDHLLFLGSRYTVTIKDVSEETFAEWQRAVEEGREDFSAVLEVRRKGKTDAEIVRSGPHFKGEAQGPGAPGLSVYYGIIFDHYDPFTGGKRAQEHIGEWPFTDKERRAARAAEMWSRNLVWRQLMENFALNEFYSAIELARWEIHFAFLSAFTHPTVRGLEIIYGRNSPKVAGFDHYASELALLYIITIASLELEVFERMSQRDPQVGLKRWEAIRADTDRGRLLSTHLWFPRGSPHQFDRVQEANRRGVGEGRRLLRIDERPRPEDLADDDIRYYANPLQRIIRLHAHANELTGFPYVSPWPRPDAWRRSMD